MSARQRLLAGVAGVMTPVTICGKMLLLFGISIWFSNNVALAANLFETDFGSGNVYEITGNLVSWPPSGTQSTFATGLCYPFGLAFDGSGNLFESDAGSGTIYKFTWSGSQSTFATGLNFPTGLAFDGSGNLFEADSISNSIYKFTPGGTRSTFATGLYDPTGLAFDSRGNLFEADRYSGNIYEFTPGGTRSTFATGLHDPAGLAFDGRGNLFESDFASGTIYGIHARRDQVRFRHLFEFSKRPGIRQQRQFVRGGLWFRHHFRIHAKRGSVPIRPGIEYSPEGLAFAVTRIPGDANLDGTVNGADLNIVLSNFNQTGMTWAGRLQRRWHGQRCGPQHCAVELQPAPERHGHHPRAFHSRPPRHRCYQPARLRLATTARAGLTLRLQPEPLQALPVRWQGFFVGTRNQTGYLPGGSRPYPSPPDWKRFFVIDYRRCELVSLKIENCDTLPLLWIVGKRWMDARGVRELEARLAALEERVRILTAALEDMSGLAATCGRRSKLRRTRRVGG